MINRSKKWSKHELKIYLLLLCSQVDNQQTQDEINMIKGKTDNETFISIYEEFKQDDEDTSIQKIETAVSKHEFSYKELMDLKKEVRELFNSDNKFSPAEQYLGRILDNIIY
jgi:hypothetical protein